MGVPSRRRTVQPRVRRAAEPALPSRRALLFHDVGGRRDRSLPLRVLQDRRAGGLRLRPGAHAPVVARGLGPQRAPLRLRRDGADDGPASRAPLRLRPLSQLPLVFLGERRDRAVARVRERRQRLHAALGPARPVRHRRHRGMVRRAAGVRRHADPQLHLRGRGQRPPLLAPVVHPRRAAARRAPRALDPHPARAARGGDAAPAARDLRGGGARRPVARQAGGEPGRPRRSVGGGHHARARLVLPAGVRASLPLDADRGLVSRRRRDAPLPARAVAAAEAHAEGSVPHADPSRQPDPADPRRRAAARRGAPRRRAHAVRLPQRRLRQVQGHAASGDRRLRRLSGERS